MIYENVWQSGFVKESQKSRRGNNSQEGRWFEKRVDWLSFVLYQNAILKKYDLQD